LCIDPQNAPDPLGRHTDLGRPLIRGGTVGAIDATFFRAPDGRQYLHWKDGNAIDAPRRSMGGKLPGGTELKLGLARRSSLGDGQPIFESELVAKGNDRTSSWEACAPTRMAGPQAPTSASTSRCRSAALSRK
jgi:hypothetical protein